MANTTISPNMNMPLPVVGVDPGPDWATNIDASLSIVDSHNHTPGQGVQITPSGINVNADLPFNGNNATTLRSVRFSPQGSALAGAADLGCLYENGVDLYYNDGGGNQIRITQSGSVTGATGTITGLPSGTASASFSASTFTFQSATATPAAMNLGSVKITQTVASGKGVLVSANGAQAADYNLTLPIALPAIQSTILSDSSGNLSFAAVASGTYNPTVTPGAGGGTGQSASGPWFYTRIGNIVSVSGNFSGTNDGASAILDTIFSLPFNPVVPFTQAYNIAGAIGADAFIGGGSGLALKQNKIIASTGTNNAEVIWQVNGGGGNTISLQVVFTYSLV